MPNILAYYCSSSLQNDHAEFLLPMVRKEEVEEEEEQEEGAEDGMALDLHEQLNHELYIYRYYYNSAIQLLALYQPFSDLYKRNNFILTLIEMHIRLDN